MAISISGNGKTTYGPSIARSGLLLYLDAANPNSMLSSVEVLVVAGGGGSGGGGNSGYQGGGGGGGGVVYHPTFSLVGETTVTVGQGGAGGTQSGDTSVSGTNGSDSQFSTLIAKGGGGGGAQNTTGSAGGSGGGGGLYSGGGGSSNQTTFTGATVYGNSGGSAQSNYTGGGAAGGGGGAGTAGGNANGSGTGGSGGQGVLFNITGTTVYYGGGGAARGGNTNGTAINGATPVDTIGTANTGAGGGGVYATSGKAGGSGIVIIRYRGSQKATGGTITSVGGFTIHTFTSSGTFTPFITDLSGNFYNGTIYNGATFSSSNFGILNFDGVDDYVGMVSPSNRWSWTPSGSGLNTMTIDIWVKTTDGSGYVVSKPWNGNGEYNYWIYQGNTFYLNSGGTAYTQNFTPYTTGNWENITCIATPTQAATYRNGVLNVTFANHGITGNIPVYGNHSIPLSIMTLYPYGGTFNQPSFSVLGNFASIRIYNRVLTAAEIAQNYRAGRARFGL